MFIQSKSELVQNCIDPVYQHFENFENSRPIISFSLLPSPLLMLTKSAGAKIPEFLAQQPY